MTTTPADRYTEWCATLDHAATIQRTMIGQRVRYTGLTGQAQGPIGRITRVTREGLRIRWEHDTADQTVHPDDITWLTR